MASKKEKEDKENEKVNDSAVDQLDELQDNEQTEVKELTCEDQLKEINDKYLRLYSDFDNFRKRTIKEKADIISSASGEVMKELLVVLDDFERAIANNATVEDPVVLKEGFELIFHKFSTILKNKGLEPIEAKGETFDSDLHEAITNVPVEDENQKGKIIDEIERGYNLKGKVLRFAKVVVGQ